MGLIVQKVSGQSYESYIQEHIFQPLKMHHSFTSEADAKPHGLATGYRYWFNRPTVADEPYNRGVNPAGYLISSADDMAHYLIAHLNHGRYEGRAILSASGTAELHRPAVSTGHTDTSYGMGWFVGPVNGIPAVFHQGETITFHSNIMLLPESHQGVAVLMNAENSLDLFTHGRMGTVAGGVASLVAESNTNLFVAYATLFAPIGLQAGGMLRSAANLRRRRVHNGRIAPKSRTVAALVVNLAWGLCVLVLLPKQLGAPLLTLAQGIPDLAYALLVSGVIALAWGVARTVWTYFVLRGRKPTERTPKAGSSLLHDLHRRCNIVGTCQCSPGDPTVQGDVHAVLDLGNPPCKRRWAAS